MDFRKFLNNNIVYLDGGLGTILQAQGLKANERSSSWVLTHPEIVKKVHKDYFDAGSNVVNTNTFSANSLFYDDVTLEKIIINAVEIAKRARDESKSTQEKFISLDIGPLGRLFAPFGDFDFEEGIKLFSKIVKLGAKCGVDLVSLETFTDSYETKSAILAVKENSDLPVLVSNAYNEDGNLLTGASPMSMVATCEGLKVDAIGANCSFGPDKLLKVVDKMLKVSSIPVLLKPNAGMPKNVDKKTVFDVNEEEFSDLVKQGIENGVRIVGGCCGTTPKFIEKLVEKTKGILPKPIENKNLSVISSYSHTVEFGNRPIIIGERINPTGKKMLKQALISNDMGYILKEGLTEQENGAQVLDVNVGIPECDEKKLIVNAITSLQAVIDLPLQIDTTNISALESALRVYNGKALINSVNGKEESMNSVFPLVKKYGGMVVALTLDEDGIPNDIESRVKIAEKIIKKAKEYGIEKKDLIFDTLTMAVSVDKNAGNVTLGALKEIKEKFNVNTILGVSNVSFGLPNRELINGQFFLSALNSGLSAGIVNPNSAEIIKAYKTYNLLTNQEFGIEDYLASFSEVKIEEKEKTNLTLIDCIIKGLKDESVVKAKELLLKIAPMEIIEKHVIVALNKIGDDYENKKAYLPQLLMSAECAKSVFDLIKGCFNGSTEKKSDFVLATVEGDVHDIGKNIVKLLLENYGFNVIDLGKDVAPKIISDTVVKTKAKMVGLSALMTTTVVSMEKTIKLLRQTAPQCKIIVGGAVLNKEYAEKIGADYYAKDGMDTVKIAQKIIKE